MDKIDLTQAELVDKLTDIGGMVISQIDDDKEAGRLTHIYVSECIKQFGIDPEKTVEMIYRIFK